MMYDMQHNYFTKLNVDLRASNGQTGIQKNGWAPTHKRTISRERRRLKNELEHLFLYFIFFVLVVFVFHFEH